jgi:phosphohistidine phosphatase
VIELHFLRHADAGDPMAWDGPDEARPLSDKGERQADRLGRFLASVGFAPDAVITSPKVRAAQTAEIVARHLGVPVVVDERVAGGLDLDDVEATLRAAGDPIRPVLVGHDPDFTDLVGELTASSAVTMKKGAMLRIDIDRPLTPGGGQLAWLITPNLLKAGR